ncbi:MAG: alpha-amlyase [Flavobacterium sp.]|uniref:glycoside hydrolase family 13 protein n=1 Tax=Flavobacterium sp. TaxID=239 RepID=UPI000C564CCF|nr:glycoside hydrolase family 13 protein [Flavobacterium sp.]MBF02375.1 alpha-amlyase [Flavobacterium sp.]|tara:strand:+ start:728 stop:2569 length:1842 start_codon:yes stop_codon:yes gene_type:complete
MKKNKLTLLFAIFFTTLSMAQITKMEPPFWYEGMNKSEIQILFYGKNIADNSVSITKPVVITNLTKTENPNYLFVTIDTKNITAQTLEFTFKKGKKTFSQPFEIKKRSANSATRKSFDASDVIYLLMPDRFANGNEANDSSPNLTEKGNRNLPGGRHGGDIQGIIDHLDYIQELGATAIWSTPLCEDNDKGYSYHTYGQSDVYQIDARYGTNEDYKRLASEMHKRNLKLIKDYVTNHWGAEHWMFKDMPSYDWFHQFPGYAQSNYRMTTQYDTNGSKRDAKYCMDGWFVPSMPDLNQSNPLVLNYLIQNAIWWIEFADLDGFRVDTYSYNDKEGIAKWTKAITDEYPYFNIVGEVWMHDQAQISYWQKNSPIAKIQSYNSYLPSVMDFTLHDAFGSVFNENEANWSNGTIKFYENFVNDFLYDNPNNLLIFIENHDTGRFNEIYKNDFKKFQLGMTLLATTRGIPQIYYGSEIGMAGDKGKGDADIRQDFPGGWKSDSNNAFKNSGRTEMQKQYFDFSKKLLNWRKNKAVIHSGKLTHYIPENNVYVYFRHNDTESVMVILNNSLNTQVINLNRFEENIKGFISGKDIISEEILKLNNEFSIEGKTALILELQ